MTTTRSAATAREEAERPTVPRFAVISGAQVQRVLEGREKEIVELVEATYRLHGAGESVNPPSYSCDSPIAPRPGSSRCRPLSAGRCGWTASSGFPVSRRTWRPASRGHPEC